MNSNTGLPDFIHVFNKHIVLSIVLSLSFFAYSGNLTAAPNSCSSYHVDDDATRTTNCSSTQKGWASCGTNVCGCDNNDYGFFVSATSSYDINTNTTNGTFAGNDVGYCSSASDSTCNSSAPTTLTDGTYYFRSQADTTNYYKCDWANGAGFLSPATHTPTVDEIVCQLFAVHDEGLNNSQFFTISQDASEIKALGEMKLAHDIEALDIHPQTGELFAASGKDTNKPGYLYNVDKTTGNLTEIGSTGLKEIDGLSFHPDGTLWGWSTGDGLVTIDTTTGTANLVAAYSGEVEDLTWNTAGTMLYGVENLVDGPSDIGTRLLAYDGEKVSTICQELTQSLEIEALDTLPDDSLIFGLHGKNNLPLGVIDVNTCQITANTKITTGYDDVEGIAWPNCQ